MPHDADIRNALSTVNTSFNTIGEDIYSKAMPGAYSAYTEVIPANGLSTYRIDFGGATPIMRKWQGGKILKQFRVYTHSLTHEPYEATMWIERRDLQYDGGAQVVSKKIGQFLQNAAVGSYDKFCFAALVANSTGYDGVSLFHASHPHGYTTNSNTGTSSLTKANVDATMLAMRSWKNEYNEPIGVKPTICLCGPANESKAKEIFETGDRIVTTDHKGAEVTEYGISSSTKQNIYQGTLKVIVDDRFVDGTRDYYWYLIDDSTPLRPIIMLEGAKPHPVKLDSENAEFRFWHDKYAYSVEGDFAAGPGFWWTAYRQAATA